MKPRSIRYIRRRKIRRNFISLQQIQWLKMKGIEAADKYIPFEKIRDSSIAEIKKYLNK